MASMRAKHAFGDLSKVNEALSSGAIDAYDILFLKDGDDAVVGWIDKDGKIVLANKTKKDVIIVDSLPESGQEQGVIYIDATVKTGSIWNGSAWVKVFSDVDESILEINTKLGGKADKSTTLGGYGITDAYTKAETDEKIKNASVGGIEIVEF